mmetsp:Transcript_12841/g.25102  ORF Transcript_12841/g.25102 Transcript_12841/m.25102 type:complete len:285 (-) Transcript_12841:141-995(-)
MVRFCCPSRMRSVSVSFSDLSRLVDRFSLLRMSSCSSTIALHSLTAFLWMSMPWVTLVRRVSVWEWSNLRTCVSSLCRFNLCPSRSMASSSCCSHFFCSTARFFSSAICVSCWRLRAVWSSWRWVWASSRPFWRFILDSMRCSCCVTSALTTSSFFFLLALSESIRPCSCLICAYSMSQFFFSFAMGSSSLARTSFSSTTRSDSCSYLVFSSLSRSFSALQSPGISSRRVMTLRTSSGCCLSTVAFGISACMCSSSHLWTGLGNSCLSKAHSVCTETRLSRWLF